MSAGQPNRIPTTVDSPAAQAAARAAEAAAAARVAANAAVAAAANERPHAPPTDAEEIYFSGSPLLGGKPEKVVGLFLLGVLVMLIPVALRLYMGKWPAGIIILIALAIGVVLWIIPAMITKTIRYRISNYRIDFERGLISKDINTLELWHVEDLALHQSIIDRLLGIGTIRIMSRDDTMPDLRMRGVPNARKIFEELKQRIIAVKRQTGVLKVDSGT